MLNVGRDLNGIGWMRFQAFLECMNWPTTMTTLSTSAVAGYDTDYNIGRLAATRVLRRRESFGTKNSIAMKDAVNEKEPC